MSRAALGWLERLLHLTILLSLLVSNIGVAQAKSQPPAAQELQPSQPETETTPALLPETSPFTPTLASSPTTVLAPPTPHLPPLYAALRDPLPASAARISAAGGVLEGLDGRVRARFAGTARGLRLAIFAFSYFSNNLVAEEINRLRDPDNPGDINLGNVAARHGYSPWYGQLSDPSTLWKYIYSLIQR
jgi:hypothetical protein